jgi:hypothetical protein
MGANETAAGQGRPDRRAARDAEDRADLDRRLALAISEVRAALIARTDVPEAVKIAVLYP